VTPLLYLYGFVPSDAATPPPELSGMDGAAVRLLDAGAFALASSEVDPAVYSAGALEERLGDLAWVGARGVEHEKVVTWFADHSTIVPVRLFTLFSSETSLLEEARRRADDVRASLRRFRGVREWDLKVSYELATLSRHLSELSDDARKMDAEIEAAAPGRRYLLERKREDVTRREAPAAARRRARSLLDELRPLAAAVTELDIPVHRDGLPVVLDAALLVPEERVEDLRKRVAAQEQELRGIGIRAQLTGPWAPYRFVSEDAHA
jgi:hypothetical protein